MSSPIRVKLLNPLTARYFLHQLPDAQPSWSDCRFSFDPEDDQYDWLVVYEDLPPRPGIQRDQAVEPLACPPANSLLVTSEPSSIKHYGNTFTRQFGCVLTSQPAWALPSIDTLHGVSWLTGLETLSVVPTPILPNYEAPSCIDKQDAHLLWNKSVTLTGIQPLNHPLTSGALKTYFNVMVRLVWLRTLIPDLVEQKRARHL